jgi:hypothetical protein
LYYVLFCVPEKLRVKKKGADREQNCQKKKTNKCKKSATGVQPKITARKFFRSGVNGQRALK